jgi:cytosine/adenosine deaminase-related metal-dependent hydrolase
MPLSLKARVVFPVDAPPIENGVVTIEGSRIISVGTSVESSDLIDVGWTALLPGLVNAHTHLEFSYLDEPLGKLGMPLAEWIRLVIAERGKRQRNPVDDVDRGLSESLGFGVTTLGDITTGATTSSTEVTHFHEVIAFSRARAESAMNALVERLSNSATNQPRLRGISPHAPYTVSPKLVQLLVSYASQNSLPMAMHLAESLAEIEFLRNRSGPFRTLLEERSMWDEEAIPQGTRPLDYLKLLAAAPRALIIHGNFLDDDELKFLGAHRERMSLVYCPRTYVQFNPGISTPYRLANAIKDGVRVALGTDSRASSPDLNLLEEMDCVTSGHFGITAQDALRIGTLNGAEALGREADVGTITVGKLANLAAFPIPGASVTQRNKMTAAIVTKNWDAVLSAIYSALKPPSAVYLAGRRLDS